jgi:hypothetical protein
MGYRRLAIASPQAIMHRDPVRQNHWTPCRAANPYWKKIAWSPFHETEPGGRLLLAVMGRSALRHAATSTAASDRRPAENRR